MKRYTGLLAVGFGLAFSSSASAVSLQVFIGGSPDPVGYYDDEALGCSTQGDISHCAGGGLVMGDLRIDSWNMTFDSDPVVTGTTAVTNLNTLSSVQFTLLFTLPTGPVGPSTLIGGSVQGGMTDNNGDDATVSTAVGSSFYAARIDGGTVQTLYADPQSFSAGGAFLSGNIANVAFGTPIPSQPAGAVVANIGIQLDFILTPSDSASFTSNFVVVAAPEPPMAALLGLGLAGLVLVTRRGR